MSSKLQYNLAVLILRVTMGGLMLTHGFPKFMKLVNGNYSFSDPLGIGEFWSLLLTVFAEFFCSIMIVIGWRVRIFVWPLIIAMAVAAFIVHWGDPISNMEKALLFLGGFLALAFTGEGKFSLKNIL